MGKKGGYESDYEEGNGRVRNQSYSLKGMVGGLVISSFWGQEKAKCQEAKWKEAERVLTFMSVLIFKVMQEGKDR